MAYCGQGSVQWPCPLKSSEGLLYHDPHQRRARMASWGQGIAQGARKLTMSRWPELGIISKTNAQCKMSHNIVNNPLHSSGIDDLKGTIPPSAVNKYNPLKPEDQHRPRCRSISVSSI